MTDKTPTLRDKAKADIVAWFATLSPEQRQAYADAMWKTPPAQTVEGCR